MALTKTKRAELNRSACLWLYDKIESGTNGNSNGWCLFEVIWRVLIATCCDCTMFLLLHTESQCDVRPHPPFRSVPFRTLHSKTGYTEMRVCKSICLCSTLWIITILSSISLSLCRSLALSLTWNVTTLLCSSIWSRGPTHSFQSLTANRISRARTRTSELMFVCCGCSHVLHIIKIHLRIFAHWFCRAIRRYQSNYIFGKSFRFV